jgi:CHAD domain
MAYRLDLQAALKPELRQAIHQELVRSVGADAPRAGGVDVLTSRKAFKRARALLRLARTPTNRRAVRDLDHQIRRVAHSLAASRDHDARIAVFDRMVMKPKAMAPAHLSAIRSTLHRDAPRIVQLTLSAAKLRAAITHVLARVERLSLKGVSRQTMLQEAGNTYRRARQRMANAEAAKTAEAFHDWRKDAQRHSRHMQLLRDLWPAEMTLRIDAGRALAALLGTDSDLALLAVWLTTADLEPAIKTTALALIADHQALIRRQALAAGQRLFAETGRAFTRRLQQYGRVLHGQIGDGAEENRPDRRDPLVRKARSL